MAKNFTKYPELMRELGAMFRSARKKRGWTGKDLANRAGVNWSTLYCIEQPRSHAIKLETCFDICMALDIHPSQIVSMYLEHRKKKMGESIVG